MHDHTDRSHQQISVAIYAQGGGALGAVAAGMACTVISHPEIAFIGGGGTSSGAITMRALWNGYLRGKALGGEEIAKASAVSNVKLTWKECVLSQKNVLSQNGVLPFWYDAANIYFSSLPSHVRDMFHNAAREHGALHQTRAPLLGFYEDLTRKGKDLYVTTTDNDPFLDVNMTFYRHGKSIWDAVPGDERVIRLNGLSQQKQQIAVAASGCLDFSKPIDFYGDGKLFHDGAFSSPIPNPMSAAKFCHNNGHVMMILRTRPTGAHQFDNTIHKTEDWMRVFFNTRMDDVITQIRETYPKLRLCVIEPDQPEQKTANLLNPEMRFDEAGVARRFAQGEKIAEGVMEKELGFVPVPPIPEPDKRQSRQNVLSPQLDQLAAT